MPIASHAERVSSAFVKLTNTLVNKYEVLELFQTLVEESISLLDAAAAGLLLADPHGDLQVVAFTSEESRLVEVGQLQVGAGPSIECFRTGAVVAIERLDALGGRWPEYQSSALGHGFHSVHSVPLRVNERTIGAMGLFGHDAGALTQEDSAIGQALADVATIGLLQERALRESAVINDQLQRALESRVVIEQAKGVISQSNGVDMNEAFNRIRKYSRSHHLSLQETANQVVTNSLAV